MGRIKKLQRDIAFLREDLASVKEDISYQSPFAYQHNYLPITERVYRLEDKLDALLTYLDIEVKPVDHKFELKPIDHQTATKAKDK